MSGGGGSDRLEGDADDDTLHGEGGSDVIKGNAGDDLIDPGGGGDEMSGGGGKDEFVIANGGDKVILDFNTRAGDEDRIDFRAFFTTSDAIVAAAKIVDIKGVESTRIVYEAGGEKATLTLVGYDYKADADFAQNFFA